MQVLTATGELAPVSARAWPLAGLDRPADYSQSWGNIQLASLSTGELRFAAYRTIYSTNPWVFAAVNLKARNIARLPLQVFQLNADGSRDRVRSDLPGQVGRPSANQRLDGLLQHPSPGVSRNKFIRKLQTDKGIYGNALAVKERDPVTGDVAGLWHAPWRQVTVHGGDNVPILSYEVRGTLGAEGKFFSPDDVIHFSAGDDPDKPIGLSPLEPLKHTMALLDAINRHTGAFFANQARLSGHLKVGPNTQDRDLERIRETVKQLYTAPENAGKVLVTSADWQAMGAPPAQSEIIELIRLSREEVLAAYNIPPPVAGILDRAIKSNIQELREQFGRDTLGPDAEEMEQDIESQLIAPSPSWNYCFVEFEFGELLRPNLATQAQTFRNLEHTYSTDERRALHNLPAIGTDDAKRPTTPLNERPVGMDASAYGGRVLPGTEPPPPPAPEDQPEDPNADETETE